MHVNDFSDVFFHPVHFPPTYAVFTRISRYMCEFNIFIRNICTDVVQWCRSDGERKGAFTVKCSHNMREDAQLKSECTQAEDNKDSISASKAA